MTRTRISERAARVVLASGLLLGITASVGTRSISADAAAPGTWTATNSYSQARDFAPAVRLGDGSVLTAGGTDGVSYTAAAGRWNPADGTWSPAGSIGAEVAGQVAALLPDGKAIFAGGAGATSYYGFGDVYDPGKGSWTKTPAMTGSHAYGAGAKLANGNLLVIGGMDGGPTLTTASVSIYSAAGNSWSAGQSLPGVGRYALTATTLGDGRILAVGGNDGGGLSSAALRLAAIYTSPTGWTATDSMNVARFDHAAVKLNDGRILVAGGSTSTGVALASAEIYNPATGHWTATGSMATPRYGFTLTVLANGWVLAAGGYSSAGSPALTTAEIYDPGTGAWTPTGTMSNGRRYHSATLLATGQVLVLGGHGTDPAEFESAAEVFTPPLAYPASTFHPLAPTRVLDTRVANGLSGAFGSKIPRLLQVTGRGNVPAGAVAVTGILTVTNATVTGYISVGPTPTSSPGSSTLNFPAGDNRANNVAVALDLTGRLALVYMPASSSVSPSTDVVFDVTGYFTADDTGARFNTLTPARVLDTRFGTGSAKARLASNVAVSMKIWDAGGVPKNAVAVTGNLTVVGPTSAGWALAGPSLPADPSTANSSMVNAIPNDIRADGVTVALSGTGYLSFVWVGAKTSTTDLVFDVTGYYMSGLGGYRFVPVEPTRVADTRFALPVAGPVLRQTPVPVPVWNRGHIPGTALGIAGNLTVVSQSGLGYLTAAPIVTTAPTPTSTLNFPFGDIRANGFYCGLAPDGTVGVAYYQTAAGASTQFVLDVTGYFTP